MLPRGLKYFELKGESRKQLLKRTKEHLQNGNNVLIVGKPGSGKTNLAWTVCKELHDEIYKLEKKWHVRTSTSSENLPNENAMTLLFLDGKFEGAWTSRETIKNILDEVEELRNKLPRKQMLIISTMSNLAYKRIKELFDSKKTFLWNNTIIVDLESKMYSLRESDMEEIFERLNISVTAVKEATKSKIIRREQIQSIYRGFYPKYPWNDVPKLGFPLIASLMDIHPPFLANIKFVSNPVKHILISIEQVRESEKLQDRNKYNTVVYACFNGGYVNKNDVNLDLMRKIWNNHEVSDSALDPEFYVFRKTKSEVYEFVHESLLMTIFAEYGRTNLAFVIKECPIQELLKYIVSKRENISTEEKLYYLEIGRPEFEKLLVERLIQEDIDIKCHRLWEQEEFRKKFKELHSRQKGTTKVEETIVPFNDSNKAES